MRKSGILLPIFSLPSPYGIGTFSKEAYEFIDNLKAAGQSYWQILPLGPTGYGDSPYQSFSTFAGNPYFIDLQDLIARGWLTEEECDACDFGSSSRYIDYEKMYHARFAILRVAYERSNIAKDRGFQAFVRKNEYWLKDYALYMAVKGKMDNKGYQEWPDNIRLRRPRAIEKYEKELADEILFYQFQQYMFHVQWTALKKYANRNGIEIIGDIPIYVAFDSADTWSNPELFQLDRSGKPLGVAGCPPDAFSKTGQLWGNPLYRWNYHKKTGYEWWMKRIAYCFELYDVVRIDHFRGFDAYYSIPYGDSTAEFGHWEKGPGYSLFQTMKERLGDKKVIAEDLGFLTDSVIELVRKTGYPGMKILQFAFDSREESDYLPHNYSANCVVYTGTHDNDTSLGWYRTLAAADRNFADRYLPIVQQNGVELEIVRAAMASVSDTAIIPMQDYLGCGSEARINTPSTIGNNWKWRMSLDELHDEAAVERIFRMTKLYGRLPAAE